jgi:SNF2 family DNA or RNA helicase
MSTYTPKTRPYQHQIDALRKSAGRESFAYFMEMGTGKTKTAIDDMGRAFVSGRIDCVLITANKGSYANWVNYELPAHMPDHLPRCSYIWTGGSSQRDREWQTELLRRDVSGVLRILVINIEAIGASQRARDFAERFVASGRCAIFVDESTLIKNHEAVRTKFLAKLGQRAVMRRIMTGSPIVKDPLDLWGQFMFLGGDLLKQRSYYGFRSRYAVLQEMRIGKRTIQKPVSFRNLDELEQLVLEHSHRVLKEDCLDLPPKVYEFRDVEMTPEQRRMYEDMRKLAFAEYESNTMTATTAMVQIGRMQQMLSGWMTDDDTKTVSEVPSNRVRVLEDLVEESAESAIVWCAYRYDVRLVAAALRKTYGPESVVEYHGGIDTEGRADAVSAFQSGRARFFVSTPATGGRGITLTRAGLVVYYSNSYDLEMRLQSEDRAHRIGQTKSVTYVDLRVPGTVDDKIVQALRKKIDVASVVMGDGAREWLV